MSNVTFPWGLHWRTGRSLDLPGCQGPTLVGKTPNNTINVVYLREGFTYRNVTESYLAMMSSAKTRPDGANA